MSQPADEPLFPCRWQHCAELFTSIRLLRHHLDDHAEVAPYVQLGGRKRRKVAEKGMWVVVPMSTSQGSHLASQAGNTTTTTTSTDPSTFASQALPLPPSFSSLPPRPIFSSPPASPPSPDPAQSIVPVQTQMPALTYNIDPESEKEDGEYVSTGGKRKIFPFAAHSQLARDASLLPAQPHGDDDPEASNVHAPTGPSELDSMYPPLSPPTKRISELADVALHEFLRSPSLQRPTAPDGERDEQEQDGSRSPFIPPTSAFQLLSSTPLDQFVMPGLGEDVELDMSLESIRGIKRGEAEAQTDLPSPPRDTAHLDLAADSLDVSQLEPSIALESLAVNNSSRADGDDDDDHLDPPSLYSTPISSALPPVSKPNSPVLSQNQSPSRALLAQTVQVARPARTSSMSAGLPMTFGSALPLPGSGTLRAKSLGGFSFGMGVMGGGSQGVRHDFGGTQGA